MARTLADVVASARVLLQDERQPYRYSDASMYRAITEAVGEARRVRPDFFLTTLRDALPLYTVANALTLCPIPDSYYSQLVNYIVGRADLRDDAFAQDGRAITLITAWGVSLTGGGR